MNVTILPGAATEDVKKIKEIVNSIDNSMKTLDKVIEQNIPSRVETKWSKEFKENWRKTYNNSIQGAMAAMLLSAANLQRAIDAALAYSEQ